MYIGIIFQGFWIDDVKKKTISIHLAFRFTFKFYPQCTQSTYQTEVCRTKERFKLLKVSCVSHLNNKSYFIIILDSNMIVMQLSTIEVEALQCIG